MAKTVIFFCCLSTLMDAVYGYYCDNDKCREDEFCCGENICCVSYKVWELWYFWCGILFCLLLLSLCGCFWRQRSRAHWVFRAPAPYSSLSSDHGSNYNPGRDGIFHPNKDRSLSPSHYLGPATHKQNSWYSPYTPAQDITDDQDLLYDTGSEKQSEY